MSKRAGAASTQDKSETGSGKKCWRADWPPSQPGEEFSNTFTGQETLRLSANDMLKVAGRVIKLCGESWEQSKLSTAYWGSHTSRALEVVAVKDTAEISVRTMWTSRGIGSWPKKAQDEAVSGFYMWIDQNGKKAMHECKLLGSVSYNLSTSSKCAALSMPSTNRPFKCKMPGCNMYVWT